MTKSSRTSLAVILTVVVCGGITAAICLVASYHSTPNHVAAESAREMIATTTGGAAARAGLEMLDAGGTAADAAMATALTQVVHAGGSYVSGAGLMVMVYYDAATEKVYYLDAQYNTPLKESDPLSIPPTGGRTALVPGFMAGVEAAHKRFGKLPFRRIFKPAINLAEQGEAVRPALARFIETKKEVLSRHPEAKRIFTTSDGRFYRWGDLLRQPELADTLRHVAAEGASYMYDGPWGIKFVDVVQRNGGKITRQDMQKYRAVWAEPVHTTYREYDVFAPGLPSWGGINIVEGMNLLDLAKLQQYGHYTSSPHSLLWFMEISACENLAWNWRDFAHDLSPQSRITKQTSAWIWDQMRTENWEYLSTAMRSQQAPAHTDGIVVVDQWGNMAAVGHTINTMLWGNTGIFVDGVSIPDSASFQQQEIAHAGAGNRLPNGMDPLIILHDGNPVLGGSAVGGGQHSKSLQVLVNILDFGMDPQAAADKPAFTLNGWDGNAVAGQVEEGAFEPTVLASAARLGIKIKNLSHDEAGSACGYWTGIEVDPKTRHMKGGVSRPLEGEVVGRMR